MTKGPMLLAAVVPACVALAAVWCAACGGADYDALEHAHKEDLQQINAHCIGARMDESKTPISDSVFNKAALDELCAQPEADARANGARILAAYKAGQLSDAEFTAQIDALQEPFMTACNKIVVDVWWARLEQLHRKSKADGDEVSLWMRANPAGRQTMEDRLREIEREFARSHNHHLAEFCRELRRRANEQYDATQQELEAQDDARRASALHAVGAGLQAAGRSLQGTHCLSTQVGGMTQTDCH